MFSLTRRRFLGFMASLASGIVAYCTGYGADWEKNVKDGCVVTGYYSNSTYTYTIEKTPECDIDLGYQPAEPSISRETLLSENFFRGFTNRRKS